VGDRNKDLARIHILANKCNLNPKNKSTKGLYRITLKGLTGKDSTAKLSESERMSVIRYLLGIESDYLKLPEKYPDNLFSMSESQRKDIELDRLLWLEARRKCKEGKASVSSWLNALPDNQRRDMKKRLNIIHWSVKK